MLLVVITPLPVYLDIANHPVVDRRSEAIFSLKWGIASPFRFAMTVERGDCFVLHPCLVANRLLMTGKRGIVLSLKQLGVSKVSQSIKITTNV